MMDEEATKRYLRTGDEGQNQAEVPAVHIMSAWSPDKTQQPVIQVYRVAPPTTSPQTTGQKWLTGVSVQGRDSWNY